MNEKTIIDSIALQNPWWHDRNRTPSKKDMPFKRSEYHHIKKALARKEAFVITGPRGVGKSTTVMELVRHLLGPPDEQNPEKISKTKSGKNSVDKRRIFYASFDSVFLRKIPLLELLKIYSRYVLKEDIANLSDKIYVFFDEIQNADDWGNQIKEIQDLEYLIKFVVTGSSSTLMIEECSKAARRVETYFMLPLKFSDFLTCRINDPRLSETLKILKTNREKLVGWFREKNSRAIHDFFLQSYNDLFPWHTSIEIHFEEYMIKGGYPELAPMKDYLECASKLIQTFWLGFHKDIARAKGLSDPRGMTDLAAYIASISSSETNYTSLMSNSGTASNTGMLKKYIYHLENACLVRESHAYKSNKSRKGNAFKIYMTDIAVRNLLTGTMNELLTASAQQYAFALETVVFDHMLRLNKEFRQIPNVFYWRDSRKNKEVDVVGDFPETPVPVEVKKSDEPSHADAEGLKRFTRERKVSGLVSCGKKLALEGDIVFVPHWLFLLIC